MVDGQWECPWSLRLWNPATKEITIVSGERGQTEFDYRQDYQQISSWESLAVTGVPGGAPQSTTTINNSGEVTIMTYKKFGREAKKEVREVVEKFLKADILYEYSFCPSGEAPSLLRMLGEAGFKDEDTFEAEAQEYADQLIENLKQFSVVLPPLETAKEESKRKARQAIQEYHNDDR